MDLVLLTYHPVTYSATLSLNRPRAGNSFSPPLLNLFLQLLTRLEADPHVHTIIITGNGKFFCTGMDLSASGGSTDGTQGVDPWESAKELFERVDQCPKPTVALINGPCYGGGNGLAFACDFRIALVDTTFVLSEVKRGLVPAIISKYLLREWPLPLFRTAALSSLPISSKALLVAGCIYSTHANLELATSAAQEISKQLVQCAPGAMSTIKNLARVGSLAGEGQRKEAWTQMMRPSEEAMEGIGAWREKREVDWIGWKSKL